MTVLFCRKRFVLQDSLVNKALPSLGAEGIERLILVVGQLDAFPGRFVEAPTSDLRVRHE